MSEKITRKEQAILTESKILETTLSLVNKNGFSNVQIKDICSNAKISVGTFYHYFKTKQDVIIKHISNNIKVYSEIVLDEPDIYKKLMILFLRLSDMFENIGQEFIAEHFFCYIDSHCKFRLNQHSSIYFLLKKTLEDSTQKNIYKDTPENIAKLSLIFFSGMAFDWCITNEKYSLKNQIEKEMSRYLKVFFD